MASTSSHTSSFSISSPRSEHRLLHWVLKILNLRDSLRFYEEVLGMKVLRHEEFDAGCEATCNGPYSRPWSKTMVGYGSELDHFVFELTYNYGITTPYEHGNDLKAIVLNSEDDELIAAKAQAIGLNVNQLPTGFEIIDYDGYIWHVIPSIHDKHVARVCVNVSDLQLSMAFYQQILGFKIIAESSESVRVGWSISQTQLELVQEKSGLPISRGSAFGRLAASTLDIPSIHKSISETGNKVLHGPMKLETPGKASVEVLIISDPDGLELCFVEQNSFNQLCKPQEGSHVINWEYRKDHGEK